MQIGVTTNADDVAKAFADLRREYPQQFASAFVHLSYRMRARAKEAIETGASPKMHVNLGFRRRSGITLRMSPNRIGFGGKLCKSIKAYSAGQKFFVGWPDKLRQYGEAFQSSQTRSFSDSEARRLRARGVTQERIDRGYDRPAREVWGPLINAGGTQQYIIDVVTDYVDKANRRAARKAARRARRIAALVRSGGRVRRRTRRVAVRYTKLVRRAGRTIAKRARRISRGIGRRR